MPKVRIFSTPTCSFCIVLKNFLKDNGVEFEDVDVSQDKQAQQEMVEGSGQMGVPVTEIDGEYIVGFDQGRIKEKLGL